jgi:hypothetical protein
MNEAALILPIMLVASGLFGLCLILIIGIAYFDAKIRKKDDKDNG